MTAIEFTVFKGSKDGKIVKASIKKQLKPDEVIIRVTHSGLCGTDEHFRHVDMGLGHKGAGVIEVSFSHLPSHHHLLITSLGSRLLRPHHAKR